MAKLDEICLSATKRVFGEDSRFEWISNRYIRPAMICLETIKQIDIDRIPESKLRNMAECAGWFVSDNAIHDSADLPNIDAVRERISQHVYEKTPSLSAYSQETPRPSFKSGGPGF